MTLTQITEKGIKDGEIVNADINASAAIAGSKISPNFGSADVVTTGNLDLSDSTGAGNNRVRLGDSDDFSLFYDGSDSKVIAANGGLLVQSNTYSLRNENGSSTYTTINSSGQVGIGTTSPSNKLVVNSAAHDDGLYVLAANNNQSTRIKLQGKSSGGTEHNWILDAARGADRFGISNGANTHLAILDDGKVGIGTTSPDTLLHLSGADTAIIRLENTDDSLVADQLIGGIEFEKLDPNGGGAGVVGGLRMYSEGVVGENTYLTLSNASNSTNNLERIRITSAGKVHMGYDASSSAGSDRLNIMGGGDGITIARGTANANDGNILGNINFHSYMSGSYHANAEAKIEALADSGQSGSSAPTHLDFYTKKTGVSPGAGATLHMRLKSSGDLELSDGDLQINNGHGIDFYNFGSGTNIDSNKLDDYEEGTFTPTVNSNMSLQSSYNVFSYVKIGKMVTIRGLFYPNNNPSGTDVMTFSLPFASANYTQIAGAGGTGVMHRYVSGATDGLCAYVQDNYTLCEFYKNGGSGAWAPVRNNDWGSGMEIYVQTTYFAA